MSPLTSDGPTEHFSWGEMAARPGPAKAAETLRYLRAHPELWPAAGRLASVLEQIRALAGRPVRVTCGLRPGDRLQHGAMQAADIQVDGLSPLALLGMIRRADIPGLRQVIAETRREHGTLSAPMARGSGLWVHVAIRGEAGEPFGDPSSMPWGTAHMHDDDVRYTRIP